MTHSQHTTPEGALSSGSRGGRRTCRYEPCSKEFTPNHPRQEFCEPTCRANQHYLDHPEKGRVLQSGALRSVATQGLDEVRGRGEESKEKALYALIAREHITHTLIATGYFSAEDFDALGVPPEHVNVCTSWIGHFSKRKVMEPISWRYSSKPSRKGGKVWTYKITQKGRNGLPALLEDTRREIAGVGGGSAPGSTGVGSGAPGHSPHSGESGRAGLGRGVGMPLSPDSAGTASPDKSLTGVDGEKNSRSTVENAAGSGASVHSGENKPLSLLPEPDPEAGAA